jgi:hypothetical protein
MTAAGFDSVIPIFRQFPAEANERSRKESDYVACRSLHCCYGKMEDPIARNSFLPSFFWKTFLIAHMYARRMHMRALDRAWIRADTG